MIKIRQLSLIILFSFLLTITSNAREEKKDLIAVIPGYFPPQYQTDENGMPDGFAIGIMNYLARISGYKVSYIIKENWSEVHQALKTGEADIIPNYGITELRMRDFYFTMPIETFVISIFVRKSSTLQINTFNDLSGKKVSVVKANAAVNILNKNRTIELFINNDLNDALFELLSGNTDALVYPRPVVLKIATSIGVENKIKIIGEPVTEIKRGMAFRKDDEYLVNEFNNIIKDFIISEDYKNIYLKWYGEEMPFWTIKKVVILVLVIMFFLNLVMFILRHFELLKLNRELIRYRDELEVRVAERTKSLEESNKELASFSYSISHDLRTPLRAIRGFANILVEDYLDKLDDNAKRYLNNISKNIDKMKRLIDDLLLFSRIGKKDISKINLDIKSMIMLIYNELLEENKGRYIVLTLKSITNFNGDSAMIQQVFYHLISNALKFSKNNHKTLLEIGSDSDKNNVIYYIKDNGVGFNEKYKDKLFKVFQRLHAASEFEGTGIGLALVDRIISKHGGEVWAEGKVNEGAVFYFSVPRGDILL